MNKKILRSFAAGAFACMILGTAMYTTGAQEIHKQLDAVYTGVKLVVNGKEAVAKDVNGKVVEPFVVDGTTYLPVRGLATMLGENLTWDEKNNTIYIGASEQINQPTKWLTDMPLMVGEEYGYNSNNKSSYGEGFVMRGNTGKEYSQYLSSQPMGEATYYVEKKYKKLTGTVILREDYKNMPDMRRLEIYADDKLVYKSPTIKSGSLPSEFSVDIAAYSKVTFTWKYNTTGVDDDKYFYIARKDIYGNNYNKELAIVDAGLWE
ncbi:MAG: NPCBM/NEW2 domain-containing protein [Eubacteriales bacterium]